MAARRPIHLGSLLMVRRNKPRFAVVMMVSQGGFGASVSGVGARKIYETLFGVQGSKVVSSRIIFPSGVPPVGIPKISPATKVKEFK